MSDAETEKRPAFKPGDVVALRGGNVRMAVESANEVEVSCVWIHEGVVNRGKFRPVVLWNSTLSDERQVEAYRKAYERLKDDNAKARENGAGEKTAVHRPWFPF